MTRILKSAAVVALALFTLAPMAAAQRRIVIVRPGPVFVRPYPYYWGYWGPGYPYGYYYRAPYNYTGQVKIKTEMKNAAVYVDGGYAGTAGQLKSFDLRPGTHDIELRDNEGHIFFSERVNVIAGKTTKINAGYPG